MKLKLIKEQIWALPIIFIIAFLCAGIFHEHFSCVFSVILLVWLLLELKKMYMH